VGGCGSPGGQTEEVLPVLPEIRCEKGTFSSAEQFLVERAQVSWEELLNVA